uniref:Preprotein translocase subunit SecE n=1 Tax=candidate division CPR3 bacterium TaxID=2268181 RepID=A0A7C5URD2_UNCC3
MVKKDKKKIKIPIVTFLDEVVTELRKTEWLSTKEVINLSITVLLSATILGFFLHFLDILFRHLISLIS